jgi:hypothetical protein
VLQIATGKLFSRSTERENLLRGFLYTNAICERNLLVETAAGKISSGSSFSQHPKILIYEFTEKIEASAHGKNILMSRNVEPYLHDFGMVLSFALNCICSPDIDLVRRLTSGERGLDEPPSKYVKEFFQKEIYRSAEDFASLKAFTDQLIALPRRSFLAVMRSVRTWVAGMHRVTENLALAYTLLVASVESLAQEFDGHSADWNSVEQGKKNDIDKALTDVDMKAADRVRQAILKHEHIALSRRFREFAVAHVPQSRFRQKTNESYQLLQYSDLSDALRQAYQLRSNYIHQIGRLPDALSAGFIDGEFVIDERKPYLTLQGLSQIVRTILFEFVTKQPSLAGQEYDYSLETYGVIRAELDPRYWVGNVHSAIAAEGRTKLEGFLSQLEPLWLKQPDAGITDLKPVFQEITNRLAQMKKAHKLPYLSLISLFNCQVRVEDRFVVSDSLNNLIKNELSKPGIFGLIAFVLYQQKVPWSVDVHVKEIENYFAAKTKNGGFRLPRTIEAAITLDCAERLRVMGKFAESRSLVTRAVLNHPGLEALVDLESKFVLDSSIEINWIDVLLPKGKVEAVQQ